MQSTASEVDALSEAYRSESGVVVKGTTAYIAGTRSFSDVAEWPALPWTGRWTTRYAQARRVIPSTVKRFVGHSLGAAVAKSLAEDLRGTSVCYGSPTTCDVGYSNIGDPVTWFQGLGGIRRGEHRTALGHGLSSYCLFIHI